MKYFLLPLVLLSSMACEKTVHEAQSPQPRQTMESVASSGGDAVVMADRAIASR